MQTRAVASSLAKTFVDNDCVPLLNSYERTGGAGRDENGESSGLWKQPMLDFLDVLAVAHNKKKFAFVWAPKMCSNWETHKHIYREIVLRCARMGVTFYRHKNIFTKSIFATKNLGTDQFSFLKYWMTQGNKSTYSWGTMLHYKEKCIRGLYLMHNHTSSFYDHKRIHIRRSIRLFRYNVKQIKNCIVAIPVDELLK